MPNPLGAITKLGKINKLSKVDEVKGLGSITKIESKPSIEANDANIFFLDGGLSADPKVKSVKTMYETKDVRKTVETIAQESSDPTYRLIAEKILPDIPEGIPIKIADTSEELDELKLVNANGRYLRSVNTKTKRMVTDPEYNAVEEIQMKGINYKTTEQIESTFLHESIHKVTAEKIAVGVTHPHDNPELYRLTRRLVDVGDSVRHRFSNEAQTNNVMGTLLKATEDPAEVITYALTNPAYQKMMKETQFGETGNRSMWQEFVDLVAQFMGIHRDLDSTAYREVLSVLDEMLTIKLPEVDALGQITKVE